ncbi:MAG TPA: M28 family metallopeptidase [Aquaticitalea sp.]|nr:M28 family metallopeptidase [Aquaticitalea sp.]HNU59527.1 M28 family metallopeptidase [Aquaticitalea sp.]
MKILVWALSLSLVGSCATKRYTEKLEDIRNSIAFENEALVVEYANTITSEELKSIVYDIASEEYQGRKTGELGHNKLCKYLKNFYIDAGIESPLGGDNYYQHVPKSSLSSGYNSTQNVVAYIKGSVYPDELLVISSHSDHLGIENDIMYPGADDNGSGTAALLEIAQAFKTAQSNGHGPKRSILFLHLTGEENGLYGSHYYTEHPIFPLDNTIANLNIDMIGRVDPKHETNPNYIYLIGADRISTELHYVSEVANKQFTNLELDYTYNREDDPNRYYYRSDHYNFALKGIPVIFYFNGEHKDYHKPTDTAEKLNYPLLETRSKLIFATAWYLVNSPKRLDPNKI